MNANYDSLYRQYHPKVSRFLRGIVGSEADDLAQDVFIKVGDKLGGLKDPSKASSWIFKIALNVARDWLRQSAVKQRVDLQSRYDPSLDALEQILDSTSRSAEEQIARNEMIQCYLEFVEKLPKNYYEVYVLSEFDDLPDRSISKQLGLPVETVKMRLHRARTNLFNELRAHCRCYRNERGELMGDRK